MSTLERIYKTTTTNMTIHLNSSTPSVDYSKAKSYFVHDKFSFSSLYILIWLFQNVLMLVKTCDENDITLIHVFTKTSLFMIIMTTVKIIIFRSFFQVSELKTSQKESGFRLYIIIKTYTEHKKKSGLKYLEIIYLSKECLIKKNFLVHITF